VPLLVGGSSVRVGKRWSGADEEMSRKEVEERLVPLPVVELPLRELLATCAGRKDAGRRNPHRAHA
jgi:hypothetical protein